MYIQVEQLVAFLTLLFTIIGGIVFLTKRFANVETDISFIKSDISDVKNSTLDISVIRHKVDTIWVATFAKQQSPLYLNEVGLKIYEESKIGFILADYKIEVLNKIKALFPENAYQAQQKIIEVVSDFANDSRVKVLIEKAAFETGRDILSILYVLALAWRHDLLKEINFSPLDINN